MNLLIHRDGQQYGRYTLDEAHALLAEGKLLPGDLALPDGSTNWKPLSSLPGFSTAPVVAAVPVVDAKRRRRMPRYISIPLYALGLLLMTFLIWRINLASQINARLAAAKAAGYPVNTTELDAWYEAVPENENAALLVMQAIEQLQSYDSYQEDADNQVLRQTPRTSPLPPSLKEHYRQRVEASRSALTLLHQAGTLSKSRYPIDLTQGALTDLKHLSKVRSCAIALKWEALWRADKNDPATAKSIQAGLALGRSLKSEPTLISQLVRIAIHTITCASLERGVNQIKFSDEQLTALGSSLHEADDTTPMSHALAGERATFIENFRATAKTQKAGNPSPDSTDEPLDMGQFQKHLGLLRWTGIFERDLRFWLTSMETNIAVAARLAPESLTMANLIGAQSLKARINFHIMSGLLLPDLGKVIVRAADDSARLRVAETALAIERFRLAHQNQLPDSLAALVPAYLKTVPTDPFDGQPLRYQGREKGYVVYSIGTDLKDNGGAEAKKDAKGSTIRHVPFDITFTVER